MPKMAPSSSVTWQWLAGITVSIVLLGGSAWMTSMYAEVNKIKEEQKQDRSRSGETREKIGVIEERVRNIDERVRDIKEGQREQDKKLDELLRRR